MTLDPWSLGLQRDRVACLPRYEIFAKQILSLIEALCVSDGIELGALSWRIKSVDSISRKLREENDLKRFGDVRDLCGIRVVVPTLTDVKRVRDLIHRELDVGQEQWLGDSEADVFGYRSLHLQVKINQRRGSETEWRAIHECEAEVQVRTLLQDGWAIISRSHDYRTGRVAPNDVRRRLFRVASLIECSDEMLDQYCKEVRAARDKYQRLGSTSEWVTLPLDFDSLIITWERYEWANIAARSETLGYKDARADDELLIRYDDDVESLVFIAQAADLKTTGELAEVVSGIAEGKRDDDLLAVWTIASKRGLTPYAVGWHVVTICLLVDHPTEVNKSVLSPHLRKAIEEVAACK